MPTTAYRAHSGRDHPIIATMRIERETFAAALWARHGDELPCYIAERTGQQIVVGDVGDIDFGPGIAAHALIQINGIRQ